MSFRSQLLRPNKLNSSLLGKRYAGGGIKWNQPTGYLFLEKPLPPGKKRVRAAWELPYYLIMGGAFAYATAVYFYRPNTSLQDWAYEEAKKRMEARGDLKYVPSNYMAELEREQAEKGVAGRF